VTATRFELRVNGAADPRCRDVSDAASWGWVCPSYPDRTALELELVTGSSVHPLHDELAIQRLSTPVEEWPLSDPRFGIDVARSAL
jgi:hypothetical protein